MAGCEKPAAQQVMSAITLGNPRYFRGLAARSTITPGAGCCAPAGAEHDGNPARHPAPPQRAERGKQAALSQGAALPLGASGDGALRRLSAFRIVALN